MNTRETISFERIAVHREKRTLFPIAILLYSTLAVAACAGVNTPIDGTVVDTTEDRPIPGAFVIAQWVHHGSDSVGSRTGCQEIIVAQSDSTGRYRIPSADLPALPGLERIVLVYVPKYQRDYAFPFDEGRIAMKPFNGKGDERLASFNTYDALRSCGRAMDISKTLRPVYAAIDEEIKSLVINDPRKIPRAGFVERLNWIDESLRRDEARKKKEPLKPG